MASPKAKYHQEARWVDVKEAVDHYEMITGCLLRVVMTPIRSKATTLLISVLFEDLSAPEGAGLAWEYREQWDCRLKPSLEPVLMRVLHDAYGALHRQPWSWTPKMRRTAASL